MARTQYYVDPSRKHVEFFHNFSGGLNTMTSNDNLLNVELPNLKNIDLGERGSLKRRYGMKKYMQVPQGKAQGFFRFYRSPIDYDDVIVVNGRIYVNGEEKYSGIQTERHVEAVQYLNELYIASGSGLLVYDGNTIKEVEPYKPKPLEALYVGTNALADNPDDYMQDGEALNLVLDGVTFDRRYGVSNEFLTVTAYVRKPSDMLVEYRFERKLDTDREWFLGQDWSTNKSYTFSTDWVGDMQFRVRAREHGKEVHSTEFLVPKFTIKPTDDPQDDEIPNNNIQSCNRILLHWDRLIMYGDTVQGDAIFISHLKNPAYFPVPNSLRFQNTKKESLQALVRFRDNLVAFQKSTIQALFGKSPQDFQRVMLNSDVGTIAPFSPKVIDNYIAFLSSEGVYVLKSVGTSETRANVERIDTAVANEIDTRAENACAEVFDNQYHLTFPDLNKRMRYYYESSYRVWTKDESPKLDFTRMSFLDGDLYAQSGETGTIYVFDEELLTDDGYVYEDLIETKFFDFDQPYSPKKLKEMELVIADKGVPTTVTVEIYLGNERQYEGTVEISQDTATQTTINELVSLLYNIRTFGKGLHIKTVLKHQEDTPNHVVGVGYIFKLKHP